MQTCRQLAGPVQVAAWHSARQQLHTACTCTDTQPSNDKPRHVSKFKAQRMHVHHAAMQELAGAEVRFGSVLDLDSLRKEAFKDRVDVVVSCLASRTGLLVLGRESCDKREEGGVKGQGCMRLVIMQ